MKYIICLIVFMIAANSFGLPLRRENRDLKLVTQQLIEKQTITAPDALSTTYAFTGVAGNTDANASILTIGITSPDVPRTLTITPAGTTTDLETCTIAVAGTNINYDSITENFQFAANASTATTGVEAFRTVSSVTFPANCESGSFAVTFSMGITDALGIKRCMDQTGHGMFSTFGGTHESTRATFTADNDEVEKNTVDLNTACDGATDVEVFFLQNFRCF
ncbi:hypothetical protein KAR91_40755 [Candidatus Pacearchaeota archaeon]|nr:hypothetical protein [Candidatus Pacearchaeota archaeon]